MLAPAVPRLPQAKPNPTGEWLVAQALSGRKLGQADFLVPLKVEDLKTSENQLHVPDHKLHHVSRAVGPAGLAGVVKKTGGARTRLRSLSRGPELCIDLLRT